MNFFRFIADMLHLVSFGLIVNQIHKTRSVRGRLIRTFLSNIRDIPSCILNKVHGPVFVLGLFIQHVVQNFVHLDHFLYHLFD
jgi:hypothetical protein